MSFLLSSMRRASAPSTLTSAARAFTTSSPAQVARMTLVGRLGTDPELVQTNKGGDVIKYVVGTGYGPRENRQTSWFRVASFAQEGSPLRDLTMGLSKGTLVYLEGDATMKVYDDADGKKQSALSLVQTKVEVLKRPQSSGEDQAEAAVAGK